MNILLLSSEKRLKCYENRCMKAEAISRGIKLKIALPEDFELLVSHHKKTQLFYKEKLFPLPNILIPRFASSYFAHRIAHYFEDHKIFTLNHSEARKIAKDKLQTLQHLAKANLPIPKTIFAKFPLNKAFIQNELNYPIILKRNEGSEGRGILLCENEVQLEDVIEMLEESTDLKRQNLILQEFISTKRGKDIRVLVVGKKVIGAILRTGKPGGFKANYSGGGTVEIFPLNNEIKTLALKSVGALGLQVAGVDILFDKESYRVCEVNASPYFEGFEKATGIDVAKAIFDYLEGNVITQ